MENSFNNSKKGVDQLQYILIPEFITFVRLSLLWKVSWGNEHVNNRNEK